MSSQNNIFTSDFTPAPYWWDASEPETQLDPLPSAVEILIVGSGYAGLNAAIELARNGRQVAVLDADRLGSGASTRTGGMISSGQKLVVGGAIKGISPELFKNMIADSIASFSFIQELVREENLDADLYIGGRYFGGHTPTQMKRLYEMGEILNRVTGVYVHKINRDSQSEVIGSHFYHGGILVDEYGGIHPGKYHRSLRNLAKHYGVQLFSHARVNSIEESANGKRVLTERGTVNAEKVLITTNGYTGRQATPNIARRIVPVKSYQIATEPLPADLIEYLIPKKRMITDSRRDLIYTRPSPDGTRLLFGSRPGILQVDDRSAAVKIRQRMLDIWPELADYRISHAWSGNVGMTADKTAHVGKMDNGDYAVGCNGNGVALMSWLGYRLAQKILAIEKQPLSFDRADFQTIPLYNGNPWFLPFASGWYRFRDAVDKRLG